MVTNPPASTLLFHCNSCGGRIQTLAQFAGVSAPCPFCAYPVTAPHAAVAANDWTPAPPVPQRPPILRMTLPDNVPVQVQETNLERMQGSVQVLPRVIMPPNPVTSPKRDIGEKAATKLDQLFSSMVELEDQLDRKIQKKGAPFDRPLRRTEDIARRG